MKRKLKHKSGISSLSPAKAQEMLNNPPHGKELTDKQERFFRARAHNWYPKRKLKK